jgi:hypothetical protein
MMPGFRNDDDEAANQGMAGNVNSVARPDRAVAAAVDDTTSAIARFVADASLHQAGAVEIYDDASDLLQNYTLSALCKGQA